MLWEIFAILAGVVWAITNILDKYTLSKLVKEPSLNTIAIIVAVGAAVVIFLFHGLSPLSNFNLALALIAGTLESLSIFLYFYAAKLDDISRVLPVWFFDTVFIAIIAAVAINETFSTSKYLGIALMIIGVLLVNIKKLQAPKISRATLIMLLASFLIAISAVITKYLLGFGDYLSILAYTLFGYSFLLAILLYMNFDKVKNLIINKKKGVFVLLLKESLSMFGNVLYIFAASIGPITLVNALSSLQPLFVLLFAVVISIAYPKILYEELKKSSIALKLFGIIFIIISAYLIAS